MTQLRAEALLFDLDGTLVYSLPAVERAWKTFARRHSLDEATIFEKIHGRRSIDSIRLLLPEVDSLEEDAFIRNLESNDTEGVVPLPGALALLESIPTRRWGIVTSGTSDVALARWKAAGLPKPEVFVFGEEVENGKPAPDPFLLGAERLGVEHSRCIGFEDTAAGLASISAAGMVAIGVGIASPYAVRDYLDLSIESSGEEVVVKLWPWAK
jgi:sugar-phosphatase